MLLKQKQEKISHVHTRRLAMFTLEDLDFHQVGLRQRGAPESETRRHQEAISHVHTRRFWLSSGRFQGKISYVHTRRFWLSSGKVSKIICDMKYLLLWLVTNAYFSKTFLLLCIKSWPINNYYRNSSNCHMNYEMSEWKYQEDNNFATQPSRKHHWTHPQSVFHFHANLLSNT